MLSLSLICFCLAITQSIAYECPEKNGLFKDPTNPHKYYDCTNGEAYPFACPEDLVFDESIKNCNYASNVKTLSPQTNPTTSAQISTHRPEVSTHGSSLDCTGKTGFFKDSTNPHIFHECVNGKDEVFHCPDNLVFNGVACDFDAKEVTKPSEHGSTNKPSVDCVGKTGFFKDSTNPHIFHECVNGKDEVFHCPDNLVFNGVACDYDSNGVTKLPEHGSTGKSSADCAGKTGLFKDPTDPHKFHECVNGVDEVFNCPEHLIFNEAKSVCDFDPNAGTGIPVVQTPNSHNTPTPVPTGPPQSEGTRQRHTLPPSF